MPELAELAPKGERRMGANPHANGGILLRDLRMPDFHDHAVKVPSPGAVDGQDTSCWVSSFVTWQNSTRTSAISASSAPTKLFRTFWARFLKSPTASGKRARKKTMNFSLRQDACWIPCSANIKARDG